jgi:hypothetical protein
MKKSIGFVDYYINEWHANNYVGWIKDASEKLGENFEVKYAFAELDKDPNEGMTTDEWCEKYGVQKCDSIDELCEKSDYIIVLAPSNPETHLRLAEPVLKYGKNTYIDKTFAPDFATAKKIFDIAENYGTKFFSSSALRYAPELENVKGACSLITTGGGSNFEEYIIHQTEMMIKTLGTDPKSVKTENFDNGAKTVYVEFASGKQGKMMYASGNRFSFFAEFPDGKARAERANDGVVFAELIKDILRFFKDGENSFNTDETLAVSLVREAAIASSVRDGLKIELS